MYENWEKQNYDNTAKKGQHYPEITSYKMQSVLESVVEYSIRCLTNGKQNFHGNNLYSVSFKSKVN